MAAELSKILAILAPPQMAVTKHIGGYQDRYLLSDQVLQTDLLKLEPPPTFATKCYNLTHLTHLIQKMHLHNRFRFAQVCKNIDLHQQVEHRFDS